jgi:hypothetical protein
MAQNQTLPLGSGLGAIRAPSLQGDANEAAFRRDASSGGILGQLLGMYPKQSEAIDARKAAQSRISDILGGLMGAGSAGSEPMFMPDESSGMNIDGSEPTQTPFYLGEAARDIGGQFVKDFRGAGRMVTDAERFILQGLFTGPNIKTGRDLYGRDFDVTGGSLNFDEEFGGTIPRATEDIIDFDVPPADFDGEMGEDLVVEGGEEAASPKKKPDESDAEFNARIEREERGDFGDSSASAGGGSGTEAGLKKDATNLYKGLLDDSLASYNKMLGLAPSKAKTMQEYKDEFSKATGIDISGDPDNKAALTAFGLALMQNKAGKGFNVGKMLSSVGEAGEKALPLMERARQEARANQLAAGQYALGETKTATANRQKFLVDQANYLRDRRDQVLGAEVARINQLSDNEERRKAERDLARVKFGYDLDVKLAEADLKGAQKAAENKVKTSDTITFEDPGVKGLKITTATRASDGKAVFKQPILEASALGTALGDVQEGITSLDRVRDAIIKVKDLPAGATGQKAKEMLQGIASSLNLNLNQEPVFEKKVIDGEEVEVFVGYADKPKPLADADAIRKRVILQFKRFLTQETGNGISNVDIKQVEAILGGIDWFGDPNVALKSIEEAKTIFTSKKSKINTYLKQFGDETRYTNADDYKASRQAIRDAALKAYKIGDPSEAFEYTTDEAGVKTYKVF